ncbi:MAG: MFS transporter [Spirochaetota bacterium]
MKKSSAVVVALAFIAFVSLGLPDGLLGVAWPGIRREFGLPLDALGVFLVASTTGYMVSSFLSGALMRAMGVGGLLAASCAATGTALAMFTFAPVWPVFVAFGSLAGLGAGAIDAGLNNYIDRNHGRNLMQWLHASFGVGITLGPLIMTAGLSLTGAWELGYRVVATAQLTLSLAFLLTRRRWHPTSGTPAVPEHEAPPPEARGSAASEATLGQSMRNPSSLLSMLLLFLLSHRRSSRIAAR